MILIALAIVVLGTYVPLMLTALDGRRGVAFLAALEGLLFSIGTGIAGLGSLYWFGLKCDEACDENVVPEARSGEWWHTLDAWQWNAQFALALVAFAAAVAAIVFPLAHRYRTAIAAVVVGLAAFCAWALMMAPLGHQFGL